MGYVIHTIYAPNGRHEEHDYPKTSLDEAIRHADILRKQGWKYSIKKEAT